MRKILNVLSLVAFTAVSGVAMAQSGDTSSSAGLIAIAAGIAIAIGAFGAASAQGKTAGAALEGITRNPSSKGEVFVPFLLALAFMEFQAILSFLIAIILTGKF